MLYISNCFSFSPTHVVAVTTYEIMKGLAKKGHEVTVFVPSVESGKRAGARAKISKPKTGMEAKLMVESPLRRPFILLNPKYIELFNALRILKASKL